MRVTEKIINQGLMKNISNSLQRLDRNYQQLSTGKRIQYPSDDPVGVTISLKMRACLREIDQYKANAETASSWLEATDASLDELTKVLHRLKEIAVYGGNETLPEDSMNALADEVAELKDHVWQVANARHENRYLFAGQQTKEPAYDDSFAYQGDDRPLLMEVGIGSRMDYSVPGSEVFGDFFARLDEFEARLRNAEHEEISHTDLGMLEDRLDQVLNVRSSIGAKVNRLERNIERMGIMEVNYSGLLSKNEDADIAEVMMQLKMNEHVYQAALATGARILQTTLVNYLR